MILGVDGDLVNASANGLGVVQGTHRGRRKPDQESWSWRQSGSGGRGRKHGGTTGSSAVDKDCLSEALRPALIIAQVFCALPVHAGRWGQLGRTLVLLLPILALAAAAGARMSRLGVSLTTSSTVVFYSIAALAEVLLWRLAVFWPQLVSKWRLQLPAVLAEGDNNDVRGSRVIIITMLVVALVEHVLSALTALIPLLGCAEHGGGWVVYKSYFVNKFPQVFELLPFSFPLSVILLYLNLVCTFLWNFVDVLIIVFSNLLAKRFDRFNRFLEKGKGKDFSSTWWKDTRETYNHLANLSKHLDAHISPIVLLSFASNLYFICLQLLHNMTESSDADWVSSVYFYFSFAWLLARAAAVSMSAASVYEQSVCPVDTLYCVPSKSFCTEVERFLVQTTTDTVALSGCRFFWVTRSLVLTLAGTVATYEIVLVQFHADKDKAQDAAGPKCFQ